MEKKDLSMTLKSFLPNSFAVTVEMKDGNKLGDVPQVLQVVNGIIQIPLPFLVEMDQSRSSWNDETLVW